MIPRPPPSGTWKLTSVEVEGTKAEDDAVKSARLVIKKDTFVFKQGDMSFSGTYKVDVTKKTKTIDITFKDGPDKGKTLLGIYELDGDTMKLCFTPPEQERPKDFTTKEGSKNVVMVFKRQK